MEQKDFNKCLVIDSSHPIIERNPFFRQCALKTFIWPYLQVLTQKKGLKPVLLGACLQQKGWAPRECFTDKIKRIRRMRERKRSWIYILCDKRKMKREKKDSITAATVTKLLLCRVASAEKIDAIRTDLGLEQESVMYVWASPC